MNYGYVRVSTKEQSTDRQHIALAEYAKDNNIKLTIYEDKKSGKDFDRDQYQKMKSTAQKGDTLVVKELDRFGRNYEDIKTELAHFHTIGVKVRILDLPLLDVKDETLSKLLTNLMIELLSYIAQKEREKIRSRVIEGVNNAKLNGTKSGNPIGRPPPVLSKDFEKYYLRHKAGEITKSEFAKLLGVGRMTMYRHIKVYEESRNS